MPELEQCLKPLALELKYVQLLTVCFILCSVLWQVWTNGGWSSGWVDVTSQTDRTVRDFRWCI